MLREDVSSATQRDIGKEIAPTTSQEVSKAAEERDELEEIAEAYSEVKVPTATGIAPTIEASMADHEEDAEDERSREAKASNVGHVVAPITKECAKNMGMELRHTREGQHC
jgi:hypothetical protein